MSYRLGVDIGGTFTDCVAIGDEGRRASAKTPSTHATTPVDGVLAGVGLLASELGLAAEDLLAQTNRLSHGTTIGTNLVVERNGARVGLITTAGHRDALRMMLGTGRTAGVPAGRLYDAHRLRKPDALVPSRRIVEVPERIAADGEVLVALDPRAAHDAVSALLAMDVEAVAVALLWSVANDAHERLLGEVLSQLAPDLYVSLSSEVSSRAGEYERTVATVINSYVGPASSRYLGSLADRLAAGRLPVAPYILQSDGGVGPLAQARRLPLRTVGSGPAGGMAGVVSLARSHGIGNVIATDMGGTSFEVGIVIDGEATLAGQEILDKHAFHVTHLDLRSIACGGGSIAAVDPRTGGLQVGPESAGADPGPACYGAGTRPTVTDADLVLGLIDGERFLGGRMGLDRERSVRAVQELADELGLSLEQTAAGIVKINSHDAAMLIRERTIEQGLDPRDFSLFAYGGAGPVHAFAYAAELGVREVIVPLGGGASTLSAYGAAASDVVRGFEHQCALRSPFDPSELAEIVDRLADQATEAIAGDGLDPGDAVLERTALLRYAEQYLQEIAIPIPDGPIDDAACGALAEAFTRRYARLYSEAAVAVFQAIEVFGVRVAARVRADVPAADGGSSAADRSGVPRARTREVLWPGDPDQVATTAVHGAPPVAGEEIDGPALIELAHTTVAVGPGQRLRTLGDGSLRIDLSPTEHEE